MTVVLDTSAVTSVVLGEPDAEAHLSLMLSHAGELHISAATRVELGLVVEAKQGPEATKDLEDLLGTLAVVVVPLDEAQAGLAIGAWRRFGKGRHPAHLNLGDCYSYALARSLDAPLLFRGDDFSQTDIRSAR